MGFERGRLLTVWLAAATIAIGSGIALAEGGEVDTTFGSAGNAITIAGPDVDSDYRDLVITPGGRGIAVGYVAEGGFPDSGDGPSANDDILVGGYTPAGDLDTSFGAEPIFGPDPFGTEPGFTRIDTGLFEFVSIDRAFGVTLQADGKILVAGRMRREGGNEAVVARLNPDGTRDTPFGFEGVKGTDITHGQSFAGFDEHRAVAADDDDRPVAAGFTTDGEEGPMFGQITRYLGEGEPPGMEDGTFGINGTAIYDMGAEDDDALLDLAIRPDGKIVAGGFTTIDGTRRFALIRATDTGPPDPAFDTDGTATLGFGSDAAEIRGLKLLGDGKIVVAGKAGGDVAVARFNENGSLDGSFGTAGVTRLAGAGEGHDVSIAADGSILVIGSTAGGDWLLAKLTANGSPDTGFAPGGIITTDLAGGVDEAFGLALQADGKAVGAGIAGGSTNAALARFVETAADPDPDPDPDPGADPTGTCQDLEATILGTAGADEIEGTEGDDVIQSLGGDDVVNGNGGDDVICLGAGNDIGNGNDGNDRIYGEKGDDLIRGNAGNDLVNGAVGDDEINGDQGRDRLFGGDGSDQIGGDEGRDRIFGGAGNDAILGGTGEDKIEGNKGKDAISAGAGKDEAQGGKSGDEIDGGGGNDSLNGFKGNDSLSGGGGNDRLHGGPGRDTAKGNAGDDRLGGGKKGDTLKGGPGDDELRGRAGPDDLTGGPGNDKLYGGKGKDTCAPESGDVHFSC